MDENSREYAKCILFDDTQNCGPNRKRRKSGVLHFSELDQTVDIKICNGEVTEKQLIESRAKKQFQETDFVCAFHRYSFGIDWRAPQCCQHPLHEKSSSKKAKLAVKPAYWPVYQSIQKQFPDEFPIGGSICTKHRLSEQNKMFSGDCDMDIQDEEYSPPPSSSANTSKEQLDSFLDSSTDISPIKFQMVSPLESYSESTMKYAKKKWKQAKKSFKLKYCEMVAPGQADKLAEIISSDSESEIDESNISKEMKDLLSAYNQAETEKQRIVILSLVSPEHYTKAQIMELFGCSKHKVDVARKWRKAYGPLQQRPERKQLRQKLDLQQAKHFLEFLFGSNLIQDVAYGTTIIKYDSGEKQLLPHAVLTAMRSHVIQDYKQHCTQKLSLSEDEFLSDSTLWKILRNIKPSQKRAMAGLDNVTANGLKGFLLLENVVTSLTDVKLRRALLRQLEQSKRYLKIGYRMHCEISSSCETHCISFALSNQAFENLQLDHRHIHTETCQQCALLLSTIEAVGNLVSDVSKDQDEENEIMYDVNMAKSSILEWMAHILRGVQQEKAKAHAMQSLSTTTGFWISDWAQKILPLRYREGQKEYFGKKGMSLHVDVLFQKDQDGQLRKDVYFTALYRSDQNVLETLCVLDHVLAQIKRDYPNLQGLYRKSDNASCYAGNSCAEIEYILCQKQNIYLHRHDYNEPQKGKDQADRESAIAKKYMNRFVNSGKDVISAEDIKSAILFHGGPDNVKVSVAEIDKTECSLEQSKIPNIQSFHSIEFEDNGMRFWQYFDVGEGQFIPYSELTFHSGLKVISAFSTAQLMVRKPTQASKKRKDREICDILFCPISGCISTFESEMDLLQHLADEEHKFTESTSGMDRVRQAYSELILASSNLHQSVSTSDVNTIPAEYVLSHCKSLSFFSQKGWAIPKRKITQFTYEQRKFIYDEFMLGEETGKKTSAEKVVAKMRLLRDDSGKKVFTPNDYLSVDQVTSMFSRQAAQKKKKQLREPVKETAKTGEQQPTDDQENDEDSDDSDFPEEEDNIQNCLEHLRNLDNLQPSDFVYVGFQKNKGNNQVCSSNHFVGQVLQIDEDEVEIKYMRKSGSYFVWPEVEDIGWTSRADIHLFLNVPSIDRRHRFTFDDIDQINMINCCK